MVVPHCSKLPRYLGSGVTAYALCGKRPDVSAFRLDRHSCAARRLFPDRDRRLWPHAWSNTSRARDPGRHRREHCRNGNRARADRRLASGSFADRPNDPAADHRPLRRRCERRSPFVCRSGSTARAWGTIQGDAPCRSPRCASHHRAPWRWCWHYPQLATSCEEVRSFLVSRSD